MSDLAQLTTTVETEEQAASLARQIVQSKLAACVQVVGPITSFYNWQDELCQSTEYRCTLKTCRSKVDLLVDSVSKLHPYEVPEILVQHVDQAAAPYQNWVSQSIRENS